MALASLHRTNRKMTVEEFRRLPEGPPYFELENGELIPMVSPLRLHQDILAELITILRPYVRNNNLGAVVLELDVFMPDGSVYIPDLSFIAAERDELLNNPDDKIHGVPDMVVEITSSRSSRDRVEKFRTYQANGVRWYWLIDGTDASIEEYELVDGRYVRSSTVGTGEEFHPALFPGLAFNVGERLGLSAQPSDKDPKS
jgi:Uma2 family endonuclease